MSIDVKICGLKTEAAVDAAVEGGAAYLGFVFYPKSARAVSSSHAAELGRRVPKPIIRCGLFVDAEASAIKAIAERVGLDLIQLHGGESPKLAHEIRSRTGLPVMKAFGVRHQSDLAAASRWTGAVDMLLFDAKPPDRPDASPGGNGVAFDWRILAEFRASLPWMLSGGLTSENLPAAIEQTGARCVDVSSGVETRPGLKDPALITAFLERARGIEPRR